MSRFSLGLEDQEQELEIDMAIDVEDKRNALAGDSMADTPFSPMVSRAFTTAVDDSETLAEMNDVLENNDIEGIPESSRQVIQTAMESVRSRLLGGYSVRGVAVEGFANNKDLKIAIEDNKNILQRAWDAIVNFFKSIYEWIAGFFGKKKNQSSEAKSKIEKSEEEAKKLNEYLSVSKKIDNNYTLKEEDSFLEMAKKKDSLSSEKPDILPINKNISSGVKPTTVEMDAIVTEIKETIAEKKPLTFDTDRFSNFLSNKKITINGPDGLTNTVNDLHKDIDKLFKILKDSSIGKVMVSNITEEKFLSLTVEDFEKDFSDFTLSNGDKLIVTDTSCHIERDDTASKVEVTVKQEEVLDFVTKSKIQLDKLAQRIEESRDLLSKFITNLSKFTNSYKPDLDDEDKEAKSNLQSIKNNTKIFNSFIRFVTLYIDYLSKAHTEGVTFVTNYQKTMSMVVTHKPAMQQYEKFADLAKLYKNDNNYIRDNFTKIRSDIRNGFFDGEFPEDYSNLSEKSGFTRMEKVFFSVFGETRSDDFNMSSFANDLEFSFACTGKFYPEELLEAKPLLKERNYIFIDYVESKKPGVFTLFWEFFLRFCKFYKIKQIRLLDRASGNDVWTRKGFSKPLNEASNDEDGHSTLNLSY